VLLFWSPAGVSVINVASAIVFAVTVPLVATAQVLLYFDLTASRSDR
jgi:hypothetical protein